MKSFISKFLSLTKISKNNSSHKNTRKSVDFPLLITLISILFIGIIAVYDSSVAIAIRDFHNQYYFVQEQLLWLVIGLGLMIFLTLIDYHIWAKFALPILIFTVLLLISVFIPHIGLKLLGAHRWIKVGFFVLQPAELTKLSLVIYLSTWFSQKETNRLIPFLLLIGAIIGLVMLEPDMGTSLILVGIALTVYFVSQAPLYHFLLFIPIAIGAFVILALISPYRFARVTSFINPQNDPLGSSYHIQQAMLAIGSGGITGVGIGKSRQKYDYLPEANTDSIFAIIAEETGFVGSCGLLAIFLFLLSRGFTIARKAPDLLGKYIAAGITGWIGIQAGLNFAAMVAFVPLTGIPLPLVSYGGSSLTFTLAAIGILLNISRQL